MNKTFLTLVVLVSASLFGCQQAEVAEAPKTEPNKVKGTGPASAIANGEELTINPQGKSAEAGSALGNK
jgi:hypothetical protein